MISANFIAAATITLDLDPDQTDDDGTVTSNPSGIVGIEQTGTTTCEGPNADVDQCTATFPVGTHVVLTAFANNGGSVDWVDDGVSALPCDEGDPTTPTCTFTLDGDIEFGVDFSD
jgi:hypothetical protein